MGVISSTPQPLGLDELVLATHRKILVVDDDPFTLEVLINQLKKDDFDSIGATSGHQALEICSNKKISLAILDYDLPGMSGLEIAKHLRPLGIPFIFLSSYSSSDIVEEATQAGALNYLVKPAHNITSTVINALYRAYAEEIDNIMVERNIRTRLEERHLLSGILHNQIQYDLLAISMTLNALRIKLDKITDDNNAQQYLDNLHETVTNSTNYIDNIVNRSQLTIKGIIEKLQQDAKDQKELIKTASDIVEEQKQCNLKANYTFSNEGDLPPLSEVVVSKIQEMLQELLMNATKYSAANNISSTINYDKGQIILSVEDDGIGFSVKKALEDNSGKHYGLRLLNRMAEQLNGTMSISSKPGQTKVVIQIPSE